MSVGAIIYVSVIAFVAVFIFIMYCGNCMVHGWVDGLWRRKIGPFPSTNLGMWLYNRSYNKQIKEQEERQKNIEEYRRLEREGLLNPTLR